MKDLKRFTAKDGLNSHLYRPPLSKGGTTFIYVKNTFHVFWSGEVIYTLESSRWSKKKNQLLPLKTPSSLSLSLALSIYQNTSHSPLPEPPQRWSPYSVTFHCGALTQGIMQPVTVWVRVCVTPQGCSKSLQTLADMPRLTGSST